MLSSWAKYYVEKLLIKSDIQINGSRPWDIQVHDERIFRRAILSGSLGFGEAYMDGWWSAPALDELVLRLIRSGIKQSADKNLITLLASIANTFTNVSRKSRAFIIGAHHYDIGNDLYERMLDKRLIYTCGYWKNAATLDEAQEHKLDLVCRKLGLAPGMRVLDIGCGWGGLAQFAAERYGVAVVGITVSKEQVKIAHERCKNLPIEIRLQDYRDVNEPFDRVISLGMFEHVGYKNYQTYMEVVRRCLKDKGLFLLQTIGFDRSTRTIDPWMDKYIFPNYFLPSLAQITRAAEKLLVVEDLHNFGPNYDKTLMAWFTNFDAHWSELKNKYGEQFYRMWKFYLLSSAAMFRARYTELWQIVFSKGLPGGYQSIR